MPFAPYAGHSNDPAAQARRATVILALPVLAGATSPWVVWAMAGRIGATGLTIASLLMLGAYIASVWWLGDREAELRKRLGRRYTPPSADLAFAVHMGLAASILAPGLSTLLLVNLIGLPRAAGLVDEYDPQALGVTGATIDLSQAIPGRAALDVIPGGIAQIVVPRFGNPTAFALSWQATEHAFCIAPDHCLMVNRRSGRVSVQEEEVGRVTSIGAGVNTAGAEFSGPPWEILNLFRCCREDLLGSPQKRPASNPNGA